MLKRWIMTTENRQTIADLHRQTHLSSLILRALSARGLSTAEDIHACLYDLPTADPSEIGGLTEAAEVICACLQRNEKIAVYGDYDADGTCAASILLLTLRRMGARVKVFIPDRHSDGYGISPPAVERIFAEGFTVLITVDNGIAAPEAAECAVEKGMTVVITDHHLPGNTLPRVHALADPHVSGSEEMKTLCGAGVAFMLSNRLEQCSMEESLRRYGQLAAIGTVADVMKLGQINRMLVQRGIGAIKTEPMIGIRALLEQAEVKRDSVTASTVAFVLAPRINAAGRMENADQVVTLLTTEDPVQAEKIAKNLCACNSRRQSREQEILQQAHGILQKKPELLAKPVLVLWHEAWDDGIIGIVASRLMEEYGRPVILLTTDGETAKGSGRSRGEFDLFEALQACGSYLLKYGGHKAAGGLSLPVKNIKPFAEALCVYAGKNGVDFMPGELCLCGTVTPEELNLRAVEELQLLEPFGTGNPAPIFLVKDLTAQEIIPLSGGKFTKIRAICGGEKLEILNFSCGPDDLWIRPGTLFDAAVQPAVNEFRGRRSVSLKLADARPASVSQDDVLSKMETAFAVLGSDRVYVDEEDIPRRDHLIPLYRLLKEKRSLRFDPAEVSLAAWGEIRPVWASVGLQAMVESGLAEFDCANGTFCVTIKPCDHRVELMDSHVFHRMHISDPRGNA